MKTFNQIIIQAKNGNPQPPQRIEKTDEEWKEILTEDQYRIARKNGTERQMSSGLCYSHEPGKYACICCNTELFNSETKFESGTGWPSFTEPVNDNVIAYFGDEFYGSSVIEVRCNVCNAHLGHVFDDGPKEQGGLRYCINGTVLKKTEE